MVTLLLAGCRTPMSGQPVPAFERNSARVAALSQWTLRGKLGMTNGERAWSGSLQWQQVGDRFAIELSGPLGAGMLRIDGDPGFARVLRGDETRLADSPDALAEALLEHPFPVTSLVDWSRGQLSPGGAAEIVERDEFGYLRAFRQHQWLVRIDEYALFSGLRLPVRLTAEGSGGRITLVVSSWQVPAA